MLFPRNVPCLWLANSISSPCMNLLMSNEFGSPSKTFATLQAKVRPFPRVAFSVVAQLRVAGEALATLGTRKWLLSCVDSHVSAEVGIANETFSALGAREWLLACMNSLVDNEVGVGTKGLSTL